MQAMRFQSIIFAIYVFFICSAFPADTLFLAHWNHSTTPDIAMGNAVAGGRFAVITGGRRGVVFRNSVPLPEALDLTPRASWISFPAKGNISLEQGTLQFWVSPLWKRARITSAFRPRQRRGIPSPACVFFRAFFKQVSRMRIPWKQGENRFYIAKSENAETLYFNGNAGRIQTDIGDWGYGSWHQIGLTWKNNGASLLYIDGVLKGRSKYILPSIPPIDFMLGSPYYGHDAESLVDELRILAQILTPDQMRDDYYRQLRGREFTGGRQSEVAGVDDVFKPARPKKVRPQSALIDQEIRAYYTTERIRVDGRLDEKSWESAHEVTGFRRRLAKAETPPVKCQSFVKVIYDNRFIYFGARFVEPNLSALQAKHRQRDLAIYSDDCFEVVFDTRNSPATFYHFIGNLIGGIYDTRTGDRNWSAYRSVCKGTVGKGEWYLEMAIPFSDLGINRPIFGEVWGVRICRERKAGEPVNSSWPATSFPFFARHDLARLHFLGRAGQKEFVKVTTAATGFSFGGNVLKVNLQNLSDIDQDLTLRATLLGDNNAVLDCIESRGRLSAGAHGELAVSISVSSDNVNLVALVVNDAGGNPVWGKQLQPLYEASSLRLCDAMSMLPHLRGDAYYLGGTRNPVNNGIIQSVALLEKRIGAFAAAVKTAIAEARIVKNAAWEEMRGVLAGFDRYRAKRDFLLWETDPWTDGTPHDMPLKIREDPTLAYELAGNEREARAICIRGMLVGGRKDVRLVPSFLCKAGDDEGKINRRLSYVPARHIRIYHAPYMRDGFRRLRTDPLLRTPDNRVALSPGVTEKYWIVFDAKDVAPGDYVGHITIKPRDTEDGARTTWRQIRLKVKVWDFALPETKDWPLDCYLWYGGKTLVGTNELAMLHFLHDYHINWCMTDRFQYDVGKTETRAGYHNDGRSRGRLARQNPVFKQQYWQAIDEAYEDKFIARQDVFLREAKRLGIKVMFAWNCCKNIQWQIKLRDHLFSLGYTYNDYALQGMSDEFRAEHLEQPGKLPFHRQMHKVDPRIQFMVTLTSVPPPAGCTYEQLNEVAKYCKIWICHDHRAWPPETESSRKDHKFFAERNCIHWIYQCATQMINQPALDYYRLYPIRAELGKIRGIALWTLNGNSRDPYDHGDGYDEGITYLDPGDNSLVPTVRLEALRDGLEDAAYMHILSQSMAAAKTADPNRDFSREEKLLTTDARRMHDAKSWDQLRAWRRSLAVAILELKCRRKNQE